MQDADIFLNPILPEFVLWPLLCIMALIGLFSLIRFKLFGIMRVITLGLLCLMLLNPLIEEENRVPIPNKVVIIVDHSYSQIQTGRGEISSHIADQLEGKLSLLSPAPEVTKHIYRTSLNPSNDGAPAQTDFGTQLLSFAQSVMAREDSKRIASLFLITDGLIADAASDTIDSFSYPVHIMTPDIGDQTDLALNILDAPQFGAVGSDASITYRIEKWRGHGLNLSGSETANVTISLDGETVFDDQMTVGEDHDFLLPIERRGMHYLDIQINGIDGDYSPLNNRRIIPVNGIRDRLKVLLISGLPYPGERVWRNLLKSDPAIDLVHFTILRPAEKRDATPVNELALISFPTRSLFEEKLNEFDLVIFDRYRRQGLLPDIYLRYLNDYVEEGGAVLVSTGPSFNTPFGLASSPLGQILPAKPNSVVYTEPFMPVVTDIGARHPVTRDMARMQKRASRSTQNGQAPWGRWFMQVDIAPTNTANILMAGQDNAPLLVLDHASDGRVAILASDQIWLWARDVEGGGPYEQLLSRLFHWLMQEPELQEERLSGMILPDGRRQILVNSLQDQLPQVFQRDPNTPSEETPLILENIEDGLFSATIETDIKGIVDIRLGDQYLHLQDDNFWAETRHLLPDLQAMKRLAAQYQGLATAIKSPEDVPNIRYAEGSGRIQSASSGANWFGIRDNGHYLVEGVITKPLISPIVLILLFLIGLAGTWWRERMR